MQLIRLVFTASREANILAISAVILLLFKITFLNRYPSLFFGAYELGVVVEAILASVVASYVFYLIVVHIKEQSDRDLLRPYIEKHSKRIVGDCLSQLNGISQASGTELDFRNLSEECINNAFSNIKPYSIAPLLLSVQPTLSANWFQYFIHHEKRSKESIRKLFDQLPFLSAELIAIIADINDCSHFSKLSLILDVNVSNPNLSVWANSFYGYCTLCRKLDEHILKLGFSNAVS